MPLYVSETFVNATEGYQYGETEPTEAFSDEVGEVYRRLRSEYGRCTGKVYVDGPGGPLHVGWVFVKREQYEDTRETYLREVWVTLHDGPRPQRPAAPYHVIGTGA